MKRYLKNIIPQPVKTALSVLKPSFLRYTQRSYSQAGEDLILNFLLGGRDKGFYIDIGANNPYEQSNTHFFYEKGWNGINIDALPGSMKKFNKARPRDINLEIPISDQPGVLTYYMFEPSFYNSFREEQATVYQKFYVGKKDIETTTLSAVLDLYCSTKKIDFMTIDVEGWDLPVLKSNNWNRFRPDIIVIEVFNPVKNPPSETETGRYLASQGYYSYCNSPTNAFFVEAEFYKRSLQE
ncbi:MAG: FkbM family methyltransferase [Flavitalea sp.]